MGKYIVTWSNNGVLFVCSYSTDYHAEQFVRALDLNGISDARIMTAEEYYGE